MVSRPPRDTAISMNIGVGCVFDMAYSKNKQLYQRTVVRVIDLGQGLHVTRRGSTQTLVSWQSLVEWKAIPGAMPSGFAVSRPAGRFWRLERARGVEPPSKAWEALVLPLNYARRWGKPMQISRFPLRHGNFARGQNQPRACRLPRPWRRPTATPRAYQKYQIAVSMRIARMAARWR